MCATDDNSSFVRMINCTKRRSGLCIIGACWVRSAQLEHVRRCLISEPDRPLADHAAFGNQCAVKKGEKKRAEHLSRSVWSRHQHGRGDSLCDYHKKKEIFHDRLVSIAWQIHSKRVQWHSNLESFDVLQLHTWFQQNNTNYVQY